MTLLTVQRGMITSYAYVLLGLGLLRSVTPEFGDGTSLEQELEGIFRFMHTRFLNHAESIAFFGGGALRKNCNYLKLQQTDWLLGDTSEEEMAVWYTG